MVPDIFTFGTHSKSNKFPSFARDKSSRDLNANKPIAIKEKGRTMRCIKCTSGIEENKNES